MVKKITGRKPTNLTRKETFDRDLEFEEIMWGLPEGIYTLPELSGFIAKKIAGFKSKNTVRKAVIEFVKNHKGSLTGPSFELKETQKLQVLAVRNPAVISGSLQRYQEDHFYDELRKK